MTELHECFYIFTTLNQRSIIIFYLTSVCVCARLSAIKGKSVCMKESMCGPCEVSVCVCELVRVNFCVLACVCV